jgi:hypothetical protein
MITATKLQSLADAAYSCFDLHLRADGVSRYILRSGSPQWVEDLVFVAHADMTSDAWRYAFIVDALDALRAEPDPDDIDIDGDDDVAKLGSWFGSQPFRFTRCDEQLAYLSDDEDNIANIIAGTSIVVIMAMGQRDERLEVLDLVRRALEARLAKVEADEAKAAEVEAHVNGLLGLMGP